MSPASQTNPNWYLLSGIGLACIAGVVFTRAPQFTVLGLVFAFLAARQWHKARSLRQQAELPPAKQLLPVLLVSRLSRTDWPAALSWLGGAPKLGNVPWPRDKKDGRPLPFLAQISLAEVAARLGPSPLPSTGSLAFFVGDEPVLYLPELQTADFTPVPADAPTLDEAGYSGSGAVAWPKDPLGPKLFPRWPVDFTVVPGEVPCRQFSFSARQAMAFLENEPLPKWWHSAIAFADGLRIATNFGVPNKLRVKRKADIEAFEQGIPAFEQFASEVATWTQGRDPWAFLTPSEAEHFTACFKRAREEFGEYSRYSIPYSIDDLFTHTLIELATAEDRAYATLPIRLRQWIDANYLLPVGHAHAMFGDAIDIQGYAAELAETNYLLLRLNNDDMLHWGFGDAGAYHFFISPAALAKRNWQAARMTFECH